VSDPTFRKPLSEADLRDVKDDAVGRLVDQARSHGAEPHIDNIERFVGPIVEKIDRDHEALRREGKDPLEPKRAAGVPRRDREGVETNRSDTLGAFDFEKGEFVPTAKGAKVLAKRSQPESLNMRAVRHVVNRIVNEPDLAEPWKRLLQTAMFRQLPPGHQRMACPSCHGTRVCMIAESAVRAIVGKFIQRFGDPRPEILAGEARARRSGAARG
jgi:hypothetical protein